MTAVFHRIGPKEDFQNPIEEILAFDGIITFDGVYKSVFEHRKALKGRDAIMFITGSQVGREGFCSWPELETLHRSFGFIAGWHGHTHRRLTELSDHAVIAELTPSCKSPQLFNNLYAYPHGDFDERTRNLVEQMGYKRAYSTTQGDDHPFSLRREYI